MRPVPLDIVIHGFNVKHFGSRMLAMAKPVYNACATNAPGKEQPILIFARPERRPLSPAPAPSASPLARSSLMLVVRLPLRLLRPRR